MAQKVRVEYPDAVCHVTSRGNQGHALFLAGRDRKLLLENPERDLMAGITWFQGTDVAFGRSPARPRWGGGGGGQGVKSGTNPACWRW